MKLRKTFLDLLILENELERQRRSQELRAEVEDAHLVVFNTMIDRQRKGYAVVDDYLEFFKDHYHGGLPFTMTTSATCSKGMIDLSREE